VKPEIEAYLREHGATYTPEALRKALIDAGHDVGEVETALHEWQARAVHGTRMPGEAGRFWRGTVGLHAAVLVLLGALSAIYGSLGGGGWIALVILAVVLIVGAAISGAIGRMLLGGTRLAVALMAPALSALVIGGSCLAFGGSLLLQRPQPPPTNGMADLEVEPPLRFAGSGTAQCQQYRDTTGFSVFAQDLGNLDGRQVAVSLESYGRSGGDVTPTPVPGEASHSLLISLIPPSAGDSPIEYANVPTSRIVLDASSDGRSGSAAFTGLQSMMEVPGGEERPELISGRISWRCE
jgi:hypothetical protein